MDNNINFTGSFLISRQKPKTWQKIYREIVPENRFITTKLFNEINSFLSVNKRYDSEIANYLLDRNIVFSYFPNIDLKSGVCNMSKKELEALIESEKKLTKAKEIKSYVKNLENSLIPADYVWKEGDHIAQSLEALKTVDYIAVDRLSPSTENNITTFIDREGRVVAKASPKNSRGINFIRTFPRYADEEVIMIKTNYKGEIHYNTSNINKIHDFKRDFLAAVHTDRHRPRINNG